MIKISREKRCKDRPTNEKVRKVTSLGFEVIATVPSLLYLIGLPPLCISVPYPVGVKKAGTPAPPALIRSAKVP